MDEQETGEQGYQAGGGLGWKRIAAVGFVLVGGVVALILTSDAGSAFAYTKPLAEVTATPEEFAGQPLRVEGELRQGSIQFREDPCEWRFIIEQDDQELAVRFPQCVVPDTFRDDFGISVTVQGTVDTSGEELAFVANELVPRCPSKYEMQERLESGEEMPHAAPGTEDAPSVLDFPEAS